ncbi:MAG: carbonic anhydrase, partial [Acetobacteraceae bacterium]
LPGGTTLIATLGAAAAMVGAAGTMAGMTPESIAKAAGSPDAALQVLIEGNKRYVAGRLTSCGQDLAGLRKKTENKQQPLAAILACADSRVPVELLFDQSIGQVFVTRVAGNIATPDVIASLEYGVAVLHVPLVLVMGHAHCGAVTAAIGGKPVPGQISGLYQYIQPAVERVGDDIDRAIRANAKYQARLLSRASPVMSNALAEKTLRVSPCYYDIASGEVTILAT